MCIRDRKYIVKKLSPNQKYAITLDNVSYHSRLKYRTPNTIKHNIITSMKDYSLKIIDQLPIKPVLLQIIKDSNIKREFTIDKIAKQHSPD